MARTICIQCESIYQGDEKFCPKDDTPLTPLVECRKCGSPMRPDAPFCAHCRGAKADRLETARGKILLIAAGALLLGALVLSGFLFGTKVLHAGRLGAGFTLAAMSSQRESPGPSPASESAERGPGSTKARNGAEIEEYDFVAFRPALLGDALRGTAATGSGGPLSPPVPPRPGVSTAGHARTFAARAIASREPVVRHAALHLPVPGTGAWRRDADLEGELARMGLSGVQVLRNNRSLRVSGRVASDGELRTLYRILYDRGFGEVDYGVEVR